MHPVGWAVAVSAQCALSASAGVRHTCLSTAESLQWTSLVGRPAVHAPLLITVSPILQFISPCVAARLSCYYTIVASYLQIPYSLYAYKLQAVFMCGF